MFFSLLLVVAVVVTDVTGDKPDTGDPGDLDNDDMVGVSGGGGGGVSAIIAEGLEPKWDVMHEVGTYYENNISSFFFKSSKVLNTTCLKTKN